MFFAENMEITTHPKELTRANLEIWTENFVKKLRRRTERTDVARLISSVERREFLDHEFSQWSEVHFKNGRGSVYKADKKSEDFEVSVFERRILGENADRVIKRSELKAEQEVWELDQSLLKISEGGEAVILKEVVVEGGSEYAIRVQAFDPAAFTDGIDDYDFQWHLSKGKISLSIYNIDYF